jgi:hypothetical protein
MKLVGKPDAGNRHVRFDERGQETECCLMAQATAPVLDSTLPRRRFLHLAAGAAVLPAEAQDHRFETDPVVTVRENFVVCDVLSQLQRVMDNPRFLLTGECEPLSAGRRVRIYASRGPFCIYRKTRSRRANGHTRKCCRNNPSNVSAVAREAEEDRGW